MQSSFSPQSEKQWENLPIVPRDFYLRPTVEVAQGLLGQVLIHRHPAGLTAGIIVETEAYLEGDPGSHASRSRTPRNAPMFARPGTIYVYRIYGVHCCLNVVTQPEGAPEAILIRALEPVAGLDLMRQRRGVNRPEDLCSGPGKLVQALGIGLEHNWGDLTSPPLYVADYAPASAPVAVGKRIGLTADRGGEAALRFGLAGSKFLSRKFPSSETKGV